MSVINRPYAGLWGPNRTKIVQHSPDALVYLNGDTSLPACNACRRNIDLQPLITSITVDAGIEPGSHSATISLSFPKKIGDDLFRDGATILRPTLEVHIYMRGYFPVSGLPMNAAEDLKLLEGIDVSSVPQYPYYPVFHGVVTNVSLEYSGGFYSASLSCSSMLHFWNFQNLSTNAAIFGSRPTNSRLNTSLRGNYYTGMSPFGIIYTLYRDTIGSADGDGLVNFALSTKTNFGNNSLATDESLFSMAIRYWEKRFSQGPYKLRMHGVNGQLLSTAQQAFLGRLGRLNSSSARIRLYKKFIQDENTTNPYRQLFGAQFSGDPRLNRNQDFLFLLGNSGRTKDTHGVSPEFFEVVVKDLGQFGTVNLFEGTYETKANMAEMAAKVSGFEFYQDVDGDLVFKPPLFNLDTKPSRAYNLKPEDIISFSLTEGEPEPTYITCRNGPFRNFRGVIDENEWGKKGQYVDYRLVAQFGFRPTSIETNYYNDAKSAFYAAVARLDIINSNVNSATVTIPMRVELRPGYPVYIPHIDCYYYVSSISHSFTFGSQCTTTLTLTARRRKFHGPRALDAENKEGPERVDLGATYRPPEILRHIDKENQPKTIGFPNVVMAMDQENINPFAFFLSTELDDLGDRRAIDQLLKLLKQEGLAQVDERGVVIDGETILKEDLYRQGESLIAVETALDALNSRRSLALKRRNKKTAGTLQTRISTLETNRSNNVAARDNAIPENLQGSFENLVSLYELVKTSFTEQSGLTGDYVNQTSGILNVLSDKKTSFAQDYYGYYRYYSSSHPNPEMQGPSQTRDVQVDTNISKSFLTPSVLKPLRANPLEYLSSAEKKVFVRRLKANDDEAGISRGLKIDRTVLKGEGESATPTHDILTLSFQRSKVLSTRRVTRKGASGNFPGLSLPAKTIELILQTFIGQDIKQANQAVFNALPGGIASKEAKFFVDASGESSVVDSIPQLANFYSQRQASKSASFYNRAFKRGDLDEKEQIGNQYTSDSTKFDNATGGGVKFFETTSVETQEREVQTPVFPVSDDRGYEVVGSYQYGRGLRIEPGGNYEALMKLDPFYYVTSEARASFDVLINEILQDSFNLSKIDSEGDRAELISQLEKQSRNPANREAFDVLSITPEDFSGEGDRVELLKGKLRNFIFDQRDGVSKVTVTNAALALSDIKPVRVEESCTFCQSGGADVQLDAFSDPNKFILIDTENIQDRAMGALAETMVGKSVDWKVRQDALRGQIQDRGRNNLWDSVTGGNGLLDSYQRLKNGETLQEENRRLSDEADRLRTLLNDDE